MLRPHSFAFFCASASCSLRCWTPGTKQEMLQWEKVQWTMLPATLIAQNDETGRPTSTAHHAACPCKTETHSCQTPVSAKAFKMHGERCRDRQHCHDAPQRAVGMLSSHVPPFTPVLHTQLH